ncbi:MAG: hypothetical protein ACRDNG_02290 [Gaiellaceae bacterium]
MPDQQGKRELLKQELLRLVLARNDFAAAAALCPLITTRMGNDLHLGLATGIVVSYIRPFTKCKVGRLEEPWSTLHDPELARLHSRLFEYRNTLYAHNDPQAKAREILVLPGDAWGTGQSTATEGLRWLTPEDAEQIKRLCACQRERLSVRIAQLLDELIAGTEWPEGAMLTIDQL